MHRLRRFEQLESRRLLAAYINEVLFDPLFGDSSTEQYVELRGEPNATLDSGTYLVVVDSKKGISNSEGKIHGIFDLSDLSFGDNGFLVLLQQNSPFTPDPRATTLQSTEPEFGGLPNDRYTDSHDLSDRIDFIYASNTFFLIQTDIAPQLGDDLDTNSDGFIDAGGVFEQWTVLDSVSTLWGLSDGYGYGQTVFVDVHGFQPQVTVAEGATRIDVEGSGYIGRIGNSTGSTAEDWAGGTVKDMSDDDWFIRFAGDVHGRPRPIVFHGRELDSVGSENFTAAARFHLFEDLNANGVQDPGESPLVGMPILADTNGNGTRDLLTTIIEPDHFEEDLELNNLTPGVTLSTAVGDNVIIGFDIQAEQDFWSPPGTHNFAHSGIDFFNSSRRLRMDFYRPAQSVWIDVIGNSNFTPTYGRLEVFDAAGNSLRMIRTGPLGDNVRQRLTIDMEDDVIAYAVAYPDDEYEESSPFGQLDTIGFAVPEVMTTTDAEGRATLNYLDPGDYVIRGAAGGAGNEYLIDAIPLEIDRYENFDFTLPAVLNEPPVFATNEFSIAELSASGTLIGSVSASDAPGQTVGYSLLEGQDLFTIDAESGQLRVKAGASLDFESQSTHVVRVAATDDAPAPMSSQAEFVIHVTDVNEAPTGAAQTFEINENPESGAVIGSVEFNDPDAGAWGLAGYRISGTNPQNAFSIDPATGELRVNNAAAFNFEALPSLTVTVEAFDGGEPSLSVPVTVTVNVANQNEGPQLLTESFAVGELVASGTLLGRIQVSDPEPAQSHTFSWAPGFTTELFTLNPSSGALSIASGAQLDYATAAEHLLEIEVTDSGTPPQSTTAIVRVQVTDQNNPPQLDDVSLEVAENAAAGTAAGTVTVTDPDVDSVATFQMVGGSGQNLFTIDPVSGEVHVAEGAQLDFEAAAEWKIIVQAVDNGTPAKFTAREYTVAVLDQNESPTLEVTSLSVAENAAAGTEVGQIVFSDPDAADAPTIELLDSPSAALFTLDAVTGVLRIREGAVLDFEAAAQHVLEVAVSDGTNAAVTGEVIVTVADANEPPVPTGTVADLQVTAGDFLLHSFPPDLFVDGDAGQSLALQVLAEDGQSPLPDWVQFDPRTGTLTANPWNAEQGEHTFVLRATDNGTPAMSGDVAFTMNVSFNTALWHNVDHPEDVTGDGSIQPTDALLIINYLNRGSEVEVSPDVRSRWAFLDVSGNNLIEPLDALRVINWLNRQSGGGEGETAADPDPALASGAALEAHRWIEDERQRRSRIADEALLEYVHDAG